MKKLVLSFIVAALFLSTANMAMARSIKAAQPKIEKVTFIHYEMPANPRVPIWDDTQDNYRLITGGVRWNDTISYEVNPTGSGLDSEIVLDTLEASSETWDAETSFELFDSPTLTEFDSIGYDGTNRIVWRALDSGVIAMNHLWYNPATKEMVESDMVFNTYYSWDTTGDSNAMDLQNIATHEFGHNGLNDLRPPKDWALTMYAYSGLGEIDKQTLGTGDILGVQRLYGE